MQTQIPEIPALTLGAAVRNVDTPSFVVSATGDIWWANRGANALLGIDPVGNSLASFSPTPKRLDLLDSIRGLGEAPLEPNPDFNVSLVGSSEVTTTFTAASSSSYLLGIFDSALLICTAVPIPPGIASTNLLTPRQNEILALLRAGKSTKEIAGALYIAEHTVRNHVSRILVRFDCHSRLEAIMTMIEHEASYTVAGDADHRSN